MSRTLETKGAGDAGAASAADAGTAATQTSGGGGRMAGEDRRRQILGVAMRLLQRY